MKCYLTLLGFLIFLSGLACKPLANESELPKRFEIEKCVSSNFVFAKDSSKHLEKKNSFGLELYGKTYFYSFNYRRYFPSKKHTKLLFASELACRFGGVFHFFESPISIISFYGEKKFKPLFFFGISILFDHEGSRLSREEFLVEMERNFADYAYTKEFALSYFGGIGMRYDLSNRLFIETLAYGVAPFQYNPRKFKREILPSLGLNFGFKF
jgi:hypothetical protein